MRVQRLFVFIAFFLLSALLIGCPKPVTEVKRVQVSGKVTLDDKVLTTGKITFDPANGEPPASFDILDGNYEGKAPVGKNKIMITAFEKVSMKKKMGFDGPGYDKEVDENRLPPRYNVKSEIFREVEDGQENKFNFPLRSN
jgi:hypothetical protein